MRSTKRRLSRGGLVALLAVSALVVSASAASASSFASSEESFVEKINAERRAAGLSNLVVNTQLTRIARGWTAAMASVDEMSHNPDLASQVKGDWQAVGENVGYTMKTGASTAELVDRLHVAFMDSPGHKANILGNYNQVGVGATITSSGKMWVTVNFMRAPTVPAWRPIYEAVSVSRKVFGDAGAGGVQASYVVLGRSDLFADSLAGAGLAGAQAPLLLTPGGSAIDPDPVLHPAAQAEIDRALGGKGLVYLLGGPTAVSSRIEADLNASGYATKRLAGASRVETSVRVAEEVIARRGATGEVLLSRSDEWADAVTGGAYAAHSGSPVVLTNRESLHPAVISFLAKTNPSRRWALGGKAALSDELVKQAGASRVAGADRAATSVAVARQLWGRTEAADGDDYVSTPGYSSDGWAYALAYAPYSASRSGPQLLVGDQVPADVAAYLAGLGYGGDVTGAVRSASAVPAPVADQMQKLVGN
ncbi:MAG TPA: cell wall-binding repeat-containing protein [Egibacteraceae bacterium]|nr:cell wall-binding repeat-containing protein [Egibacteraceae bacterium]